MPASTASALAGSSDSLRAKTESGYAAARNQRRFLAELSSGASFDLLLNLPVVDVSIEPAKIELDPSQTDAVDSSHRADSEASTNEVHDEEQDEQDDPSTPNAIFAPVDVRAPLEIRQVEFNENTEVVEPTAQLSRSASPNEDIRVSSDDQEDVAVVDAHILPADNEAVTTNDLDLPVVPEAEANDSDQDWARNASEAELADTDDDFIAKTETYSDSGPTLLTTERPKRVDQSDTATETSSLEQPSEGQVAARSIEREESESPSVPEPDRRAPKAGEKSANTDKESRSNRRLERLESIRRGEESNSESKDSDSNPLAASELERTQEYTDANASTDTSNLNSVETASWNEALPNVSSATSAVNGTPVVQAANVSSPTRVNEGLAIARANSEVSTQPAAIAAGSSSQTNFARPTSPSSATGATGTSTLTPYQEQRVLHRILRGLEQLSDRNGQVRLRLHPPELGSLQVTLRVEAQQVTALVEVEHTASREVLNSNLPQLQSRLADQGLQIQHFEVRVVEPGQFSQGGQLGGAWQNQQGYPESRSDRRSNAAIDRLRNRIQPTANDGRSTQPAPRWTRTQGQLDVTV